MRRRAALLVGVLACAGCAHTVKEIAREGSRAAVDESVDKLTEEGSKEQIADALADPRVAQAISRITDQITEGVLKSLESERTQQQVSLLTRTATRAVTQQMMSTLGSDAMRTHVAELTSSVSQAVLADVGKTLHNDFVPGLRDAIATDLADGAAVSLTNAKFSQALGTTAQGVAYSAVLGASDGLRVSWLGETGDRLREGSSVAIPWLKFAGACLLLLALCVLSLVAFAITRTRRTRSEVRRLEAATLLLATAMREHRGASETDGILSVVSQALENSAAGHQSGWFARHHFPWQRVR